MNRRIGLAGLLIGMSASVLMQTLIATSLPAIASDLGGMSLYSWVFGAYMLASTVTIPLFGKLADRIGRRPMYLLGLSIFLLGTLLAGSARSMEHLVGFRVIQGIGAGALAPAALASIGDLFDEKERSKVFGTVGVVQILANLAGPSFGRWITDHSGWRWGVFSVVPVGLVAAVLARQGLPSTGQNRQPLGDLDWQGAGLMGIALLACLLGMQVMGGDANHFWLGASGTLLGGVVLVVALRWERRHHDPVLPMELLSQPVMSLAALGTLLLGTITHGSIAFIPLLVHGSHDSMAMDAGAALLPMLLAAGIGSALSGHIATRPRVVTIVAWLGITAGLVWFALIPGGAGTSGTIVPSIGIGLGLGLGLGILLPIFLEMAQMAAGKNHRATASGVVQLSRNLGGAVGVPLLGIWLLHDEKIGTALPMIFWSLAGTSVLATLLFCGIGVRAKEIK